MDIARNSPCLGETASDRSMFSFYFQPAVVAINDITSVNAKVYYIRRSLLVQLSAEYGFGGASS